MPEPKSQPPPSAAEAASTDTRERILAAAAELIGAKGFNGSGLSEILKRAGVARGSFYHYFPSKEALGVALIDRARDEHVAQLRPILGDRRVSPRGRLLAVFQWGYRECRDQGMSSDCLITKLALETSRLSDPVQAAVQCAYQQWEAEIVRVLREAQAAGELNSERPVDLLARLVLMLWEGATLRMQIDRSLAPLDDFLQYVFGTLLPEPP